MYTKPVDPDTEGAGYGYSNAEGFEEDVFYYHSDHLGSTSYITDKEGEVTQFVSYKPYGELLVDEHAVSFDAPYKFNGKELDSETGLYYYGARYYEASLAAWYGVDALAEKYPSVGGYVYCAGNPVKLVDADGRKIKVAKSNSQEYNAIVKTIYKYLMEHDVNTLRILNKVDAVIIIKETNGVNKYNSKTHTIYWNCNIKILTDQGKVMSAALCLVHEAEHALQSIRDYEKYQIDMNTENDEFHNLEDKRIILGPEQDAAEKLGETEKGEPIRRTHSGTPLYTDDPKSCDYKGELDTNIEAPIIQKPVTESGFGYLGRVIILLIGAALLTKKSCCRSDCYTSTINIDSLSISSIGIETLVEFPISKNELIDECIHDGYNNYIIKDCNSVSKIYNIIKRAASLNKKYKESNYTVVIVLYNADFLDTVWVGVHQIERNNILYKTPLELINYIDSIDNEQLLQIEIESLDLKGIN